MRKKLSIAVLLFISLFVRVASVLADEIISIDVEAVLRRNGSAEITEIWTTADVYTGTQISRRMDLPNNMTIHSLKVQDASDNHFDVVTDWDSRTTFEERATHASILTTDTGYEIVWGITNQGDNRYVITYKIEGLVQGFIDGSGFQHHFVPNGIEPTPNSVSLQLRAINFDIANSESSIELKDMYGRIEASDTGRMIITNDLFDEKDALTIRAFFADELFTPTVQHELYFDDLWPGESSAFVILFSTAILSIIALIIFLRNLSRTKLSNGTVKKWPCIEEIPIKHTVSFDINLPAIYYLLNQKSPLETKGLGSAFGAYLLKWSHEGLIDITQIKNNHLITLYPLKTQMSEIEQSLYKILEKSLGKKKKLPSNTKKLERMMKQIREWEAKLYNVGKKELQEKNVLSANARFTPTGYNNLLEFWGFIKYLKGQYKEKDLSQPFEHDHLIIATMAGFKKELKKYFDKNLDQSDDMFVFWQMMWMVQAFDNQIQAYYQNLDTSISSSGFDVSDSTGGGDGGINC